MGRQLTIYYQAPKRLAGKNKTRYYAILGNEIFDILKPAISQPRWQSTARAEGSNRKAFFKHCEHAERAWPDEQGFRIRGRTLFITSNSGASVRFARYPCQLSPVAVVLGLPKQAQGTAKPSGRSSLRNPSTVARWSCRACARAPGVLLCLDRTCPCFWVAINLQEVDSTRFPLSF